MKKKIVKVLLLFIMIFGLAACNKNELQDYKIKVVSSSWSENSAGEEPEEKTSEYDIVLDKKYVVNSGSLGLTFTITKINKDKIIIETTDRFSNQANGINLRSNKHKFMIKIDKPLDLTTPTIDAGNIYHLSLEKIK